MRVLPPAPNDPVGRDGDLARLFELIKKVGRVELVGEDGVGKTTLLSTAVYGLDEPALERLVYIDCRDHRMSSDLLSALFFAFYAADYAILPTPTAAPAYLQKASGVVILDNLRLELDDVERVVNALPACVCVAANTHRQLSGRAALQMVSGLGEDAGATPVMRELGRAVPAAEQVAYRELARAWAGHPLHLHRCADLLREGDATVQELIDTGWTVDQAVGLDGRIAATLGDVEGRLLILLAAVLPQPLPAEHVEGLIGDPQTRGLLHRLHRRGLLQTHSPTYSLREPAGPALIGSPEEQQETAAGVARSYAEWAPNAGLPERWEVVGALGRLQTAAFIAHDDTTVMQLGRALEPVLALAGRWDDWKWALRTTESAADRAGDQITVAWAKHQQGVRAACALDFREAMTSFAQAASVRSSIADAAGAELSRANFALAEDCLGEEAVAPASGDAVAARDESVSAQPTSRALGQQSSVRDDDQKAEGGATMQAT